MVIISCDQATINTAFAVWVDSELITYLKPCPFGDSCRDIAFALGYGLYLVVVHIEDIDLQVIS